MSARRLLVMLPGAYFRPDDFAEQGFLSVLRAHVPSVDAVVADLPAERYLDGDVAPWLHHEIIAPALVGRPGRAWLLGISLGGMGALLYAQAHPEMVEGIVLLAPFLGSRGLVAEVHAAGGLDAWRPGAIAPGDLERRLMAGLKAGLPPRLYLGYGARDRYAPASRLLAAILPAERVIVSDGAHDWPTWKHLWDGILKTLQFDDRAH